MPYPDNRPLRGDSRNVLLFKLAQVQLDQLNLDPLAISSGLVPGRYTVNKFGRNEDVDGPEDLWRGGGDYTGWPTAAAEEFEVVSSSDEDGAGTLTGALSVRIFYLNPAYEGFDAAGEWLTVDVTLNGTTPVPTGVSGMRVWRVVVLSSGSTNSNVGTLTIRWRTTTSVVFAAVPPTVGQTEISQFTIPAGFTGHLLSFYVSMNDNTSNEALVALRVRAFGSNTFLTNFPAEVRTAQDISRKFPGGIAYAEKTDIGLRVFEIANLNGRVEGGYTLVLFKN